MSIEVGDYIRTNLGNIGKIIKEYTFKNKKVEYPEPQEWVLDNGYVLNEAMMFESDEEIVARSKNVVDLIEVGDYVNDIPVVNILPGTFGRSYSIELSNRYIINRVDFIKVKSILTHEQYEKNCYRLEE